MSLILGEAIAQCFVDHDGLACLHLPEGLNDGVCKSIVKWANQTRPADPPFAVLVSSRKEDLSDPSCLVVSSANAIQYRQGNRLAVVDGRLTDLKSFSQAFTQVLGPDFPGGTGALSSLTMLSRCAVERIVARSGAKIELRMIPDEAATRLANCLGHLAEAYQSIKQGAKPWNILWFDHVSLGLDRLASKLADAVSGKHDLELAEFFRSFTFAAFSLPRPSRGLAISDPDKAGKRIAEAIDTWWADQQRIVASVARLASHPDTDGYCHALDGVDWSGHGRTLVVADNALLAFMYQAAKSPDGLDRFAELTENQFFDPHRRAGIDTALRIYDLSGSILSLAKGQAPFVLSTESEALDADEVAWRSESVRITLPRRQVEKDPIALQELCSSSGLAVRCTARGVEWDGVLGHDDGVPFLEGRLVKQIRHGQTQIEPFTLEVSLPTGDPLADVIAEPATATVILMPPEGATLLVFSDRGRTPQMQGQVHLGEPHAWSEVSDQEQRLSLELDFRGDYRVLVWNCSSPKRDGRPLVSWNDRELEWTDSFKLATTTTFDLDGTSVELSADEEPTSTLSPLLAATLHTEVDRSEVSFEVRDSLRGRLEDLIVQNLEAESFGRCLGHIALGPDDEQGLTSLRLIRNGSFLGSEALESAWQKHFNVDVPADFMSSKAVAEFRDAFHGLELPKRMTVESGVQRRFSWPSRTSFRELWASSGRESLARYLGAYSAMMQAAADHGSPSAIFWATYPFSVSVWSADVATASAILLSPLHPIRLTWLAAAEWALSEAGASGDSASALALGGSIEGWNLPLIGPRGSNNGRMVAVPIDSGPQQLFVGWSMMAFASIDDPQVVRVPPRIGGLASPGTSSSGLNAASTEAALRDYRRVNPHVSTLTLDLAATEPSRRMEEVDKAVLAALASWSQPVRGPRTERVPRPMVGGFRVLDSLNRQGDSPRGEVAGLLQQYEGIPITWTRYNPAEDGSKRCNLRLLQDSGIKVAIEANGNGSLGVIGDAPLRRFEAGPSRVVEHSAKSQPAVPQGSGWEPFTSALRHVESALQHPELETQLFNALLADERADWTVSGETHMSPAAMAQLLAGDGPVRQMLWEWRPPMLEAAGGSVAGKRLVLERRPFVSVVRVPAAFKSRLGASVSQVLGTTATEEDVDGVLAVLGARGVGLSSLVSMGGTHVAGALGFYLSLRLLNAPDARLGDLLVMPLDACESFLRTLAAPGLKRSGRQKADLLAIALTDDAAVLIPIEIKFYGLLAKEPPSSLPELHSAVLDKSVSQLNATMDLLRSVEDESKRMSIDPAAGRSRLWANSLATFLDAAIRLRGNPHVDAAATARRLQRVVDGSLPLIVGRPVINFFGHAATTSDGEPGRAYRVEAEGSRSDIAEVGALIVNPRALWSELDVRDQTTYGDRVAESGPLLTAWTQVFDWAVGNIETVLSDRSTESSELGSGSDQAGQGSIEPISVDENSSGPEVEVSGYSAVPDAEEDLDDSDLEGGCIAGVRFDVGSYASSVGGNAAEYWPGNTALTQMNIGVVGDLGTGKTQLLKTLIHELRDVSQRCQPNPLSFLVFDYKRDYQDETFCKAVGGEVIPPFGIPLNIFALAEPYSGHAAFQKAQSFIDVLSKIYGGIGPVQRNNLGEVITALFRENSGKPPTLKEVLRRYQTTVAAPDSVVAILNSFVMGEIFSDDPEKLVPFETLIDDKVAVVALDKLGVDDQMKNAVVVLFLNFYNDYMLRLTKWNFETRDGVTVRRLNSFLLVDEALNIMKYEFPVLERLLLQGREFGLGVILASQYLTHFKQRQTNYAEPLLTWFIHRVPAATKGQLQALGLQEGLDELVRRIPELPVHRAIYKSLNCPGRLIRGTPFYELSQRT